MGRLVAFPRAVWYTPRMQYVVELKPRAKKDLRRIAKPDAAQIIAAMNELKNDLHGDVKRLTNFTPEYRSRIGDYRALFEIEKPNRVVVYRVRHRRDAYRN
jgi:mRNA interferase RelE/StbE